MHSHTAKILQWKLDDNFNYIPGSWGCTDCSETFTAPPSNGMERIEHSHVEYVPGCFACKIKTLQLATGDAKGDLVSNGWTNKKWDKELNLYRDARKQGIQPDGTSTAQIQKAMDVSDKTGHAFGSALQKENNMAKKMTKAQMEAFKKKNFDKTKKVSKDQLDKLRKEGTPDKAIAKYKNDPAMREALNRFYGKDRVSKAAGSSSSSTPSGGPGAKMPKRPAGGPGSKMTARDGRGGAKSSTAKPASNKSKMVSTAIPGRNLSKMTPAQRKRSDQLARIGRDVILPASLAAIPVAGVSGGIAAAGARATAAKVGAKQVAAKNIAARSTSKADEAIKLQKAATAAKNAAKTGRGSGAGSAARAAKLQRQADAAKAAANKAAEQARNANARARSLGSPTASKVKTPKSPTATAKTATSGTAKQADEMLMNMKNLAKKKSVRRTGYAAGTAAYLARPNKKDQK